MSRDQGLKPLVAFGTPSSVPKGGRLPCRTTNLSPGHEIPCGLEGIQGSGHKTPRRLWNVHRLVGCSPRLINMLSIISSSRAYSICINKMLNHHSYAWCTATFLPHQQIVWTPRAWGLRSLQSSFGPLDPLYALLACLFSFLWPCWTLTPMAWCWAWSPQQAPRSSWEYFPSLGCIPLNSLEGWPQSSCFLSVLLQCTQTKSNY